MIRFVRPALFAFALFASLGPLGQSASAQEGPSDAARQEAAERFRRGLELYQEGGFEGALIEFQAAYEAAPTWRIRFNIGQVLYQMRDYAGALSEFELFLAEGGDRVSEEQMQEVEAEMVRLRSRIGTLVVEANVEGAAVYIDSDRVGEVPFRRRVNIGRHEVRVEARGHQTRQEVVTVASGSEARLEVELEELAQAGPVQTIVVEDSSSNTRPILLGVTGGIAGAGLITMAAGLGLWSINQGELDDRAGSYPGDRAAVASKYDEVQTAALITDIGIGVAAVGAIAFVTLLVVLPSDDGGNDDENAEPEGETALRFGPGSFAVSRTF